jgi:hypothetical protein
MFALLAICLSLCPHPKLVEESVNNQLQENYAEKMLHLQCSDEAMFDELFFYVCPKFITHPHPTMASPSSTLTRYGVTANYVPTQQFFHSPLCDFCTIFCCKGGNPHLSIFISPCCVMNPGNVIFLFSFFLCCYSDTLEYGHHLEAVKDAYRLQLKLFLSEVANSSFLLAFEAS